MHVSVFLADADKVFPDPEKGSFLCLNNPKKSITLHGCRCSCEITASITIFFSSVKMEENNLTGFGAEGHQGSLPDRVNTQLAYVSSYWFM